MPYIYYGCADVTLSTQLADVERVDTLNRQILIGLAALGPAHYARLETDQALLVPEGANRVSLHLADGRTLGGRLLDGDLSPDLRPDRGVLRFHVDHGDWGGLG